ncbi:M56 family metallopeptidase [Flavimarina sp. Hel_I_48]|uniref:M56 family metallopeptidase n=1 Tax=Flavimarina sp. Hel_I_48 TaxID=1392488 RepID=UPI00068DB775|nr:M56 family metallopeptidase [Flavimarina sp. Hel_I_48]
MTDYLIKSGLCLLVLWGFYKLALEQQNAHTFKRFYLLLSLLLAFILPLITITYSIPAVEEAITTYTYINSESEVVGAQPIASVTNWWVLGFWIIYGLGVLIFGFRFLRNIDQIRTKIRHNMHVFNDNSVYVLLDVDTVPHTFINYIFLSKAAYEQQQIAPEILLHEQAHVDQKHTLDILFIEMLQVVFWFNPLLHFIKKSVALNHEFLADRKVLNHKCNPENYINLLLQYAQGAHHTTLTSAINYSLTKKRIVMLSQPFSARQLASRLAFLLPILAFCIYFFNQEIVAKPINPEKEILLNNIEIQKAPILKILINDEKIYLNKKETTVNNFAKTIDRITAKWTEYEMMNYTVQLQSNNGVDKFMEILISEFHKTKLYKTNPSKELLPPPPPPAPVAPAAPASPATKNAPPVPLTPASPAANSTPPSPISPPAPPAPPSADLIIEQMTSANADFYYNGTKISAARAKELFSKNKNLNFLSTEGKDSGKPMVLITDN